jgi:hypothetical protein
MSALAEDLQGAGKVLKDGVEIGEVAYSIRVYKAGVQGWAYPFAHFKPRQNLDFHNLVGKVITLRLEDGRQWKCIIQSLDGRVSAVGDWPAVTAPDSGHPDTA